MPLLSMSSMLKGSESDSPTEEAVSFCAKTQLENLTEVFSFYRVDIHKWLVCLVQDNASVNVRLASLLGVPYVGFLSHKLALQVKNVCE